MTTIQITIDSREHKLILHFKDYSQVEVKNLEIGDIIFFKNEKPILIIERKTISDLYSSIIDGRYREQKARLIQSNCNFCYLIEGLTTNFKNNSTIYGSILNLLFRDDIKVIRTNNINESIKYIDKLLKKFEKNDFEPKQLDNIKNYKIKKADCYNQKDCFKLQLNLIPGVSLNMAKQLSEQFENMNNLIKFLEEKGNESLKDIEYQTSTKMKKIGVKMSDKIYKFVF